MLGENLLQVVEHGIAIHALPLLALNIGLGRQMPFGSLAYLTHHREILLSVIMGSKAEDGIQHTDLLIVKTCLTAVRVMLHDKPHRIEALGDILLALIFLIQAIPASPAFHRIEILHSLVMLYGPVCLLLHHDVAHHSGHTAIRGRADPVDAHGRRGRATAEPSGRSTLQCGIHHRSSPEAGSGASSLSPDPAKDADCTSNTTLCPMSGTGRSAKGQQCYRAWLSAFPSAQGRKCTTARRSSSTLVTGLYP